MRNADLVLPSHRDSRRDKFLLGVTGTGSAASVVKEDLSLYFGSGERLDIMVAQALTEYLGDKLKGQAKIDKGRREAGEERELLANPAAKAKAWTTSSSSCIFRVSGSSSGTRLQFAPR